MTKSTRLIVAAATAMTALQPCLAADDLRDLGNPERRTAMFAGANMRLGFGARAPERVTARLQLAMTHSYQDRRSASPPRTYRAAVLEVGASNQGTPAVHIGGMPASRMEKKLGISTIGAVAIGAAAVVGLMLVAFAASSPPDIDWTE